MDIGMLWFDPDKKTDLVVKVERAARYYQQKYAQTPNLCYVHPDLFNEHDGQPAHGVELRKSQAILPNHFWIGVNDNGAKHE